VTRLCARGDGTNLGEIFSRSPLLAVLPTGEIGRGLKQKTVSVLNEIMFLKRRFIICSLKQVV
jgi:hypothetical protein